MTTEDELKKVEALHRMTETNQVDISSAPLELLGESIETLLIRSLRVVCMRMDARRVALVCSYHLNTCMISPKCEEQDYCTVSRGNAAATHSFDQICTTCNVLTACRPPRPLLEVGKGGSIYSRSSASNISYTAEQAAKHTRVRDVLRYSISRD